MELVALRKWNASPYDYCFFKFIDIFQRVCKWFTHLDVGDIYIEPPEPAELTDEDSADEDGGGLVDNLSANQFRAAAEISIYQQNNTNDNEIISEALEEPK
ncbi:hypothetical protein JTB14_026072 [Gonioctena quinquepunctata]|nr:hypothetical protein JTB14_026072 [Gonioctena quinquepunctata]